MRSLSIGLRAAVVVLFASSVSGCVTFDPDREWHDPHLERAQVKQQDGVTVSTVVLEDDEAQSVYGVDLANGLVRAIWLERTSIMRSMPLTKDQVARFRIAIGTAGV